MSSGSSVGAGIAAAAVSSRVHALVPGTERDPSVRARVLGWRRRGEPIELTTGGRSIAAQARLFREIDDSRRHVDSSPRDETCLVLRSASPWLAGRIEATFLRRSGFGVYELDDGLPFDDGRLPDHSRAYKRLFPKSVLAARCAVAADRIVAGNEVLADWAASLCDDVVIIPTCVEPDDYESKADYTVSDPPRIGWIGSAATEVHLWSIAGALREVHARTGARLELLTAAGNRVPESLRSFTSVVEWGTSTASSGLARWDVGVMPLPDRAYERAKCAYKLLEYGAAGLPMVGSPVGASRRVLELAGAPAPTNTDDWVDALVSLLTLDAASRARNGRRGREVIASDYSYDAWTDRWRGAMRLGPAFDRT